MNDYDPGGFRLPTYGMDPMDMALSKMGGFNPGIAYGPSVSGAAKFGAPAAPLTGWGKLWGGFMDKTDPTTGVVDQGWGGMALDGVKSIGGLWSSMKQYGLAKDQLKFQKDAFNRNYNAQRQTLNTQLEDRQRARISASPNNSVALSTYMDQNRIR